MRYLSPLLLLITCFCAAPLQAGDGSRFDYDFNQERMYVNSGQVFLISTFDTKDGLTVYNFNGQKIWEVAFSSKILSWNVGDEAVFVFSKARDGHKTILTCLNRRTGQKIWERP